MFRNLIQQGLFHLLSANFLIQFLGFGTVLLVPRFVSPEALGEIKVIQSYGALFVAFAGFSFNNAVLKLCSEPRPLADKQFFLKTALFRAMLTTALSYAVMAALALAGVLTASPHTATWLLVYGLTLPFAAITLIMTAYLQALKEIREMARAQTVVKLQSVPLILLATWVFGFEGFILSTVVAVALGLWPFFRQTGFAFLKASPRPLPRLFMHMAWYSVLSNGIHKIGKYADIYVLGLFEQDQAEIGYYGLATIFVLAASVVTATLQRIVVPNFSEKAHDEAWIRHHLWRLQAQTLLVSIGVAAVVRMGAWGVIRVVYDPAYMAAIPYLDILLLKYILWSAFAIVGIGFISLGIPKYNFIVACITTPVGLALSYLLLEQYGTIGVAWAQVAIHGFTLVLLYATLVFALKRYYRDGPPPAPGHPPLSPLDDLN